jgi:colanic acid/amylovoran biosynthesis glycosyltransferase
MGRPETQAASRIALVVPIFPKLSETFIVRHFLGLLARGSDVHVVCDASPAEAWRHFPELAPHAARVHCNPPTAPRRRAVWHLPWALARLAVSAPGVARRLVRAARRDGAGPALRRAYRDAALLALAPDLVHWEFGAAVVGREALKELMGPEVRWLLSFRGYDLNHSGFESGGGPEADRYYAAAWRVADGVHCLGEDLRRKALRRGCPPGLPLALIPPAVDLPALPARAPAVASGPLRILSVGRVEWKKGYEYALLAIAQVKAAGVDLRHTVIGEGEVFEALAFARHQLGLESEVELLGAQSPSVVAERLRQSDVFLHLAVSEGFCNAVVEAQAAGVPVVCSDAGGLPENVADGETGFVVPRREAAAAAERLLRLAGDPALRARMGAAGRERVARLFQIERQIDAFLAFYGEILGREVLGREVSGR